MVNKQDFYNAVDIDITMVRGDTMIFNFQLGGLGRASAYTADALPISLGVAEHYYDPPLFEVTRADRRGIQLEEYDAAADLATFSVRIAPYTTRRLDINRYYYDLRMRNNGDGDLTLMRGRFILVNEVKRSAV